jgi:type IV pilus assembly protein PilV
LRSNERNAFVRRHCARCHRTKGFTLIEALVALVVLSVGLLGVAGLQMIGLRANLSAASRTQASYLADDIIDRMRANTTGVTNGEYAPLAFGATIAGTTTAAKDVQAWVAELRTLPAGQGSIAVDLATNIATVTIKWVDSRGGDVSLCTGPNLENCTPVSFTTSTQL